MTTISATHVLSSSHSVTGDVLHTLLLRYPRFIHSEFMTHRVFSRNAASSRAIPVQKMIDDIIKDPTKPLFWGMNEKGMQSFTEADLTTRHDASVIWERAMHDAIAHAKTMTARGLHKQIINRLLEPFMHITVLVSSTQWSNFLALRDHGAAEPHMQMLAKKVRVALEEADYQVLQPGQWHLPFVSRDQFLDLGLDASIKLSTACCASTSYKTVEGFEMTIEKATELHDKLVGAVPLHASPAEHVAQADWFSSNRWHTSNLHGNFTGFNQYRKMLPGECQ